MFKRAGVIAAVVVVMAAAVGCGGGSNGEEGQHRRHPAALRHAAQATLDKKTSKLEFTMR